jgi:hypothetical protein
MPYHHALSSSCGLHLLLHLVQKDMHPIRSERSPLRRPQAGVSWVARSVLSPLLSLSSTEDSAHSQPVIILALRTRSGCVEIHGEAADWVGQGKGRRRTGYVGDGRGVFDAGVASALVANTYASSRNSPHVSGSHWKSFLIKFWVKHW